MNLPFFTKIKQLVSNFYGLEKALADPKIFEDLKNYQALAKQRAKLLPLVEQFHLLECLEKSEVEAKLLLNSPDPEWSNLAQEELSDILAKKATAEEKVRLLLLPEREDAHRNCFLEIRAGTGGEEASLFAQDLFKMYQLFTEQKPGWSLEITHVSPSETGGFKEIIAKIMGTGAYGTLELESGGHRVQRVPQTEAQGRVHTSACTVLVMPEIPECEIPSLNASELRIDTFRASGAGGQHVNKTDSAVRITHLPTGLVATCQNGRSQHHNRTQAMAVLAARLASLARESQSEKTRQIRQSKFSSGNRSDRIRTYNFPQGRLTEHRIGLTLYRLPEILSGHLELILDPLHHQWQLERLADFEMTENHTA